MNRLAQSHSPYLLQHKDNPVDWQPWDESALGFSRILVASVQHGGFLEASTPASNGSPKSSLGGATFVETARTIGALSTGISLPKLRPRRA